MIAYWMHDDDIVDDYILSLPSNTGSWTAYDFMGNEFVPTQEGDNHLLEATVYPSYLMFEGSQADLDAAINAAVVGLVN